MTSKILTRRNTSRRTLIEEINHFSDMFGYRNRFFMPNFSDRIAWLSMGAKDLFEVVRKGRSEHMQQVAVARVFARIVAVDEFFRTDKQHLPFVKLLCQKYPLAGCSYCKTKPCLCPPDRKQSSDLDAINLDLQKKWTGDDWQQHLSEVYGQVNGDSTWDRMFAHLISEIIEISQVSYTAAKYSQDELILHYAKELADAFAWTCGVASKMNVSIGAAVERFYGQGCNTCEQPECKCPPHQFDFLDLDAFEARYLSTGIANTAILEESR